MVSTRTKRQPNGRLFSQLDDFDKIFFGITVSNMHEKSAIHKATGDQEFTVDFPGSNSEGLRNW